MRNSNYVGIYLTNNAGHIRCMNCSQSVYGEVVNEQKWDSQLDWAIQTALDNGDMVVVQNTNIAEEDGQ